MEQRPAARHDLAVGRALPVPPVDRSARQETLLQLSGRRRSHSSCPRLGKELECGRVRASRRRFHAQNHHRLCARMHGEDHERVRVLGRRLPRQRLERRTRDRGTHRGERVVEEIDRRLDQRILLAPTTLIRYSCSCVASELTRRTCPSGWRTCISHVPWLVLRSGDDVEPLTGARRIHRVDVVEPQREPDPMLAAPPVRPRRGRSRDRPP